MPLTHVYERARSLRSHQGSAGRWAHLAVAAVVSLLGAAALAGPALATPQQTSAHYTFTTLDNQADPTFNQLLGINQSGTIAGYFGSGAAGSSQQGLPAVPALRAGQLRQSENFPGSTQTQVTGLNDRGVTVGFWSDANNANQMTVTGVRSATDHRSCKRKPVHLAVTTAAIVLHREGRARRESSDTNADRESARYCDRDVRRGCPGAVAPQRAVFRPTAASEC